MFCGNEAGSYLRFIGSCITQLKAQGPFKTCSESKEEEEEEAAERFFSEARASSVSNYLPHLLDTRSIETVRFLTLWSVLISQ